MLQLGLDADRLGGANRHGAAKGKHVAHHHPDGRPDESSNVTMVLTGLPGSPIHGMSHRSPKPTGAPGRMRSFQKRSSAPSSSSTDRT